MAHDMSGKEQEEEIVVL